ncbi:hypothetical protein SDC49_15600 [Lactobacillus sp. R2/2]|nr:hypothetical protein [Lactobacillus sp. R2/2]
MITNKANTEFWVITDTHLIADSLHDDGQAFQRIQDTSQGKDLVYQETALRAFTAFANEKSRQLLLLLVTLLLTVSLFRHKNLQKYFVI